MCGGVCEGGVHVFPLRWRWRVGRVTQNCAVQHCTALYAHSLLAVAFSNNDNNNDGILSLPLPSPYKRMYAITPPPLPFIPIHHPIPLPQPNHNHNHNHNHNSTQLPILPAPVIREGGKTRREEGIREKTPPKKNEGAALCSVGIHTPIPPIPMPILCRCLLNSVSSLPFVAVVTGAVLEHDRRVRGYESRATLTLPLPLRLRLRLPSPSRPLLPIYRRFGCVLPSVLTFG